jgi:hypothetical protein
MSEKLFEFNDPLPDREVPSKGFQSIPLVSECGRYCHDFGQAKSIFPETLGYLRRSKSAKPVKLRFG